jgi:hypothetical protein
VIALIAIVGGRPAGGRAIAVSHGLWVTASGSVTGVIEFARARAGAYLTRGPAHVRGTGSSPGHAVLRRVALGRRGTTDSVRIVGEYGRERAGCTRPIAANRCVAIILAVGAEFGRTDDGRQLLRVRWTGGGQTVAPF